jgi:catechol 2,3-dioxygenase-like lactoylglutathione lyase family enzyme
VNIEQVDFVSVATRDTARALAFYRDVLGLPESEHSEAEIETPNVTLSFWNPEQQGEPFAPNESGIALRVPDVAAAVEEFRAAGGEVVSIVDSGVCHMGFVKDLDGNVLILHRRYAPKGTRAEAPLAAPTARDPRTRSVPSETTGRDDRRRRNRDSA